MTYEEYAEDTCLECGKPPSREDYEAYLLHKIQRLERIIAMSPEERAEYDARQAADAEMAKRYTEDLIHELRPAMTGKQFLRFRGSA